VKIRESIGSMENKVPKILFILFTIFIYLFIYLFYHGKISLMGNLSRVTTWGKDA
jgi:cell division protein FtsB